MSYLTYYLIGIILHSNLVSSASKRSRARTNDSDIMMVPGRPAQSEAYFGMITSNHLKLMTPAEAEEADFPALHLFQGGFNFDGL